MSVLKNQDALFFKNVGNFSFLCLTVIDISSTFQIENINSLNP